MDIFQRAVCGASRLAAQLSAVLLVAMVCHIIVEIVLRSFFATSTFVLDEVVGYGVAAMTFLSLGYALEQGAMIRVNVLITRVGGMPRRALELWSRIRANSAAMSWCLPVELTRRNSRPMPAWR